MIGLLIAFVLGVVCGFAIAIKGEGLERELRRLARRPLRVDDATMERLARELRTHRGGGGWRA